MPTNSRDAFRGQSRSPKIVTFHMLGIVSEIFNVEKCRDLEIGVRGHSRSLKVVLFGRSCMVSY